MPVHDWARVEAGIFHAFHVAWVSETQKKLNDGLLPQGFYALAEQHAGRSIADVLTLHASPAWAERMAPPPTHGGTAVADAPPRVRRHQTVEPAALVRQRRLAIRHVSGHRLIALLEILSPANKDGVQPLEDFTDKCESALRSGVHVLLVDLFAPGPHDARGIHDLICRRLEGQFHEPYDLPADEPLTLAGYMAGTPVEAYLEHLAVGAALPEMPLFLSRDRYVNVPLEACYLAAYRGMPGFWRDVLDGRQPAPAAT